MVGTYNYWLVLFSVAVAIWASYLALDLTTRIAGSPGHGAYWVAGGAVSMGFGIWSMHFIGMLAFTLPIPLSHDIPITGLSLLIAIAASGFALYLTSRPTLGSQQLLAGGVLMGFGIAAMHYTGMAAMRMQPPIQYQPALFALSVLVAVVASIAALWSAFRLRMETLFTAFWKKTGSAVVMGAAIVGMHYTGMAAAVFAPGSICTAGPQNFNYVGLTIALGGLTFVLLVTKLALSGFDAYQAERAARFSEQQLRRLYEERQSLVRDLHDNIVQAVYATGLKLEEVQQLIQEDPPRAVTHAAGAIDTLNGVIGDIRRYIGGSTGPISAPQLRGELARLVKVYGPQSAPRFRLNISTATDGQLAPDQAEQVLQITREALSNSLRHSHARHGTLTLGLSDRDVTLEIRDDGDGFDPAHPKREGSGLHNMEARARQIGARLEVLSSPGRGTRIVLHIPRRENVR